jgi:hypothetical protein
MAGALGLSGRVTASPTTELILPADHQPGWSVLPVIDLLFHSIVKVSVPDSETCQKIYVICAIRGLFPSATLNRKTIK